MQRSYIVVVKTLSTFIKTSNAQSIMVFYVVEAVQIRRLLLVWVQATFLMVFIDGAQCVR